MVIIRNDFIVVSKDDPSVFYLKMNLSFHESGVRAVYKNGKRKEIPYNEDIYFYIEDKDNLYIQRGLLFLLEGYFNNSQVVNEENNDICNIFNISDITYDNTKDILNVLKDKEMILRDYQFLSLRKMILLKRCIIQLSTGAGKTEVMSAFIKLLSSKLGYTPTTLVIEPTVNLVNSIIERFKSYGIDCYSYRDNRTIEENKVIVCHPMSLCNDLENNNNLLSEVRVMLSDECHHLKSITWRSPATNMPNLQYSIGLSATAISQDHVNNSRINEFNINELFIIASTGRLAMNMTSGLLIENNALATPVVLRMTNRADEYINEYEIGSWHKKLEVRLQSDTRNDIVLACAEFFVRNNRKVLILVNTIGWSRKILKLSENYDLSDKIVASYGGGRFEVYNYETEEYESRNNAIEDYKNGNLNILIGTSHLYEGFDVPNLDVIILAYGGKGDRIHLQGLGRALRKTKNGNMAYIVDFTDYLDKTLSNQSNIRLDRYINNLRVPKDRIYNDIYVSDLDNIFKKFEE